MSQVAPSALVEAERDRGGEFLPHVVAWNLTRRCNLACTHCYISAGPWQTAAAELDRDECRRVVDELLAVNPSPMLILSGGEPLVREDLPDLCAYASSRGATVVVGTNGTALTDARVATLKDAGVSGVAVSVDSLDESRHDGFRGGAHALERTVAALERLRRHRLGPNRPPDNDAQVDERNLEDQEQKDDLPDHRRSVDHGGNGRFPPWAPFPTWSRLRPCELRPGEARASPRMHARSEVN